MLSSCHLSPFASICFAVRRDHGDVEARRVLIVERAAGEERLHPDHVRSGHDGKRETPLDRSAAGLGEPHVDVRLKRLGRSRQLVEIDGEGRLALVVGLRQVGERNGLGRDFVLFRLVLSRSGRTHSRIARTLLGPDDVDLALDVEACGRRAVEEAPVERDLGRRVRRDAGGRRW